MNRLDKIFSFMLAVEGGYTNDKNDKGGETKWATKKAQVTLNRYFGYNLVVDGIFGSKTIKALNEVEEQGKSAEFLRDYHSIQRKFYHSIVEYNSTQKVFLTGWLNRVDRKEKYLKEIIQKRPSLLTIPNLLICLWEH